MNSDFMMDPGVPIGMVERETGLTRDVLRKWEVRYGFPLPDRNERGERTYPPAQLDRLRLIKRLLDRGMRPVKIVGLDADSLRQLADTCAPTNMVVPPYCPSRFVEEVLISLKDYDPEILHRVLTQELMRIGLGEFVHARLAHLNEIVGDAWADGQLAIYQEHLYAETVQMLLREAIARLPTDANGPRILLATPPGELHTLGILMVQAQFSLAGARCISLGCQVPMSELVAASNAYRVNVIGLSFSIAYPMRRIAPQLIELRHRLDPAVQIWAGGQGIARVRGLPAGVHALLTLAESATALATLLSPDTAEVAC
ncbi:MAG: MerR family transcriptional regulator [Burkholderiaceae bacterium]